MRNGFVRLSTRAVLVVLIAAVAAGFSAAGPVRGDPQARMTIDTAAHGQRENPRMWGLFIENICHDVDGGLYSQMIRNPDFKNDVPPADCTIVGGQWRSPDGQLHRPPPGGPMLAWRPVADRPHQVSLQVVSTHPLAPVHRLSMHVNVLAGTAGVGNIGYWGMPIRAGRKYLVTFYARTSAGTIPIELSLTNTLLSRRYARHTITISSSHWRKFHAILTADGTTYHGMLALTARSPAQFNFTLVQMFPLSPRTGKPRFFRSDIVRLLARLHPGFLRFPGGNFIEGISLADSYNWRKTVGPMIDRPGHMNFWGYRNTDGFGYLGWLRLARRLHAAPMYCTSAGLLWNAQTIKGTRLAPFIHRMLTAVAFAQDPVGTRWGNLRARYGHPRPIPIPYVEIGNENGGPSYNHNYPIMEAALHSAFPHVVPIADNWGGNLPPGHLQIIDQHFYPAGRWFRHHADLYNSYSASAPRVLVGEYAVGPTHSRYGDFRMTLAETAFMIGMERNCSKVIMASYGVTLDNAGAARAHINLIQFNNRTAFGRSMYWVQYLFNHQQPAVVYPIDLQLPARRPGLRYRLFADAGVTADHRDLIIKVDNASATAVSAEIALRGPTQLADRGTAFTLHTTDPSLDNDFRHPTRITPVRRVFSVRGSILPYRFKPYSITVLRLRVKS